jgi:predicted DNA-binding protein (UPF0251 family)
MAKEGDKCAQFYLDYYRISHSIEGIDNMANEMDINRRTFFRRMRECREKFKEILGEYKNILEYF